MFYLRNDLSKQKCVIVTGIKLYKNINSFTYSIKAKEQNKANKSDPATLQPKHNIESTVNVPLKLEVNRVLQSLEQSRERVSGFTEKTGIESRRN